MNYDKVSLLLPMNGANNGTDFPDWSPVPKTVTRFGSPVTSTAQFKYYDSSGSFPTNSDYLTVPYTSDFAFGSGNFTLEAWVRITTLDTVSGNQVFAIDGSNSNFSVVLRFSASHKATLQVTANGSTQVNAIGTTTITSGVWYHIAGVRDGNTLRIFLNGVEEATTAFSSSIWASPARVAVAAWSVTPTQGLAGNLQDLRITKGVARYTANFTPPTRLIGTISNSAVGAGKILDVNGDPAERTVFAVPRSAPTRVFSDVSNASGEFEIQAPAGVDHSVVALAESSGEYNDIVHRVIPE